MKLNPFVGLSEKLNTQLIAQAKFKPENGTKDMQPLSNWLYKRRNTQEMAAQCLRKHRHRYRE
jgi:hypothetical protein